MDDCIQDRYEMHAIVKGRVQGVGFRATARYYAKQLGLTGTVRNLPDGNVEIYAQGTKQHLKELMQKLKQEIGLQQISEATIEYFPLKMPQQDFRIIH